MSQLELFNILSFMIYIYIYNCLKKKIRSAKFDHNFFIRIPFWVFLVPLEILESVESKYSQKEHFLNYYEAIILKILQLVTFFLS